MIEMLNGLFSYLILLPAAVLCYLPVHRSLRGRPILGLGLAFCVLLVLIVLASYLSWRLHLQENDLLAPLMLVCYLCFHFSLRVHWIRSLTIFAVVAALMSILTNYGAYFDAVLSTYGNVGTRVRTATLVQLVLSILAVLTLAHPFWKHGVHLVEQRFSSWVWGAMICYSVTIICSNLTLYPLVYRLSLSGLSSSGILLLITAQLTVWILILVIVSAAISDTLAFAEMREQNRVMKLMENQIRSQQKYIKASEKTRHDFRHNILTMAELYDTGKLEELGRFLHQYADSIPVKETATYCANSPLNAILNYYAFIARSNQIDLSLRIDLPESLPISDTDLCSMVGNILENAVIACQESRKKQIQLTLLYEPGAYLYIVASNSFNGVVRQRNGSYLSTKRQQNGVGLESIADTAERYGGVAQFSHQGKQFFSNIAIPLE